MKKSIFALVIASIFAFTLGFVGCKKADEAKPEEQVEEAAEQVKDDAVKAGEEVKGAAEGIVKKAVDTGKTEAKKFGM